METKEDSDIAGILEECEDIRILLQEKNKSYQQIFTNLENENFSATHETDVGELSDQVECVRKMKEDPLHDPTPEAEEHLLKRSLSGAIKGRTPKLREDSKERISC